MDFPQGALPAGLPDYYLQVGLAYLGCTDALDCAQAQNASPLASVDPTDPAFYLAHSIDEDLPEESTVALAAELETAGVPVILDLQPGSAHSVLMMDDPMFARILAFYREHL
jgi:hypothetical protein